MSLQIKNLSADKLNKLNIRGRKNKKIFTIQAYLKENNIYNVPLNWGKNNSDCIEIVTPKTINSNYCLFNGSLRKQQIIFMKMAIKELNKNKCCFLSLHTGFGKTVCAIYLITKIRLKTMILVHLKDTLAKQWINEIKEFTNIKPLFYETNRTTALQWNESNVIICMERRVKNIPSDLLKQIQFLIVDEAKLYFSTERVKTMLRITPMYSIGLSADIKRSDGMHKMLPMFFGSIIRKISQKSFNVYGLYTSFKPEIKYKRFTGDLDWSLVQKSIAEIKIRNKLIAYICLKYKYKKILILCDRIVQAEQIVNYCKNLNIDVNYMYGKKKSYFDSRVLIGTGHKLGIGFDSKTGKIFDGIPFQLLILASDVKNVEQKAGRILGRINKPVIFDIIDDFSTFSRHWDIRKRWYLSRNGNVSTEWLWSGNNKLI